MGQGYKLKKVKTKIIEKFTTLDFINNSKYWSLFIVLLVSDGDKTKVAETQKALIFCFNGEVLVVSDLVFLHQMSARHLVQFCAHLVLNKCLHGSAFDIFVFG